MEGSKSMDARARCFLLLIAILPALGASARTQNFVVTAPTQALADEIAQAAETFRRELALEWLETELPAWRQPCPLVAKVNPQLGAGGRTSFMFERRVPFGWDMEVQGSRERILDSVLPHEVTHTIFATHFGRPLPRWADEGACTTVEHHQERRKQEMWLIRFLKSERGIPFNHMFAMTEYPGDIMPLYSQGYSVARYLIAQGGKPKFVKFVGRGMDTGNWVSSVNEFYGFKSLGKLQVSWVEWVKQGSPRGIPVEGTPAILASNQNPTPQVGEPARNRSTPIAQGPRPLIDNRSENLVARNGSRSLPAATKGSWYARKPQEEPVNSPSRNSINASARANQPTRSPVPASPSTANRFAPIYHDPLPAGRQRR